MQCLYQREEQSKFQYNKVSCTVSTFFQAKFDGKWGLGILQNLYIFFLRKFLDTVGERLLMSCVMQVEWVYT